MHIFRVSLVLAASFVLAACFMDHRKEIAFHVLFNAEGWPNTDAFAQALTARFPPGSTVKDLEAFVTAGGGSCHEREAGHRWCEFVTHAHFCEQSMLGIDITLKSGAVGSLKVVAGGLGC